ncbi:hypothetical protein F2P81_001002 [Scophthalmus maximus]|uniref:Uncharacterized protein n=1 Tax=Scophthalmus maximus TaxID=52904 RepID=A0A6A4TR60_SCOMX|nr:hypothetical protein F2P81_001002 [Scophthalmus maximus]
MTEGKDARCFRERYVNWHSSQIFEFVLICDEATMTPLTVDKSTMTLTLLSSRGDWQECDEATMTPLTVDKSTMTLTLLSSRGDWQEVKNDVMNPNTLAHWKSNNLNPTFIHRPTSPLIPSNPLGRTESDCLTRLRKTRGLLIGPCRCRSSFP